MYLLKSQYTDKLKISCENDHCKKPVKISKDRWFRTQFLSEVLLQKYKNCLSLTICLKNHWNLLQISFLSIMEHLLERRVCFDKSWHMVQIASHPSDFCCWCCHLAAFNTCLKKNWTFTKKRTPSYHDNAHWAKSFLMLTEKCYPRKNIFCSMNVHKIKRK